MSGVVAILIILLCVLGEAFFSGSEIALVSVDRFHLKHAAKNGHRASRQLQEMLKNPERILGTTLLGTNICVVTSTTVAATQFYHWLGGAGVPISIVIMTFVNLVFAEIVPKSVFQQKSDHIAPRIIYVLWLLMVILFPLVWLFSKIAVWISRIFGRSKSMERQGFVSKEELRLLMKMKHDKGDVKPSERRMINRLLNFTETTVNEIMIPLIDVAALSEKAKIGDAYDRFIQTKHRRLPVYKDRIDRLIGILNSFDILGESSAKSIKPLIRPASYVPPTMGISELLEDLQNNGRNMAIVVDEYGGAVGIVTVEDILEEVVGDIEDEYDEVEDLYRTEENGVIIVNGRMPVDDLNDRLRLSIPEGEYETIGGFVISQRNRIPRTGEKITLNDLELTVSKASSRTVGEVIIRRLNQEEKSR